MFEFVSTELGKQQQRNCHQLPQSTPSVSVETMMKCVEKGSTAVQNNCNTSPDSGIDVNGELPPLSSLSSSIPPPLHRADSPPVLDGPPRTPSPCSPSPPVLPYSPAPLDGPYSPVPSNSPPPALQSNEVAAKFQRTEQQRITKDKFFNHKGKFHPKAKGWKLQQLQESEAWY